MAGKDAMFIGGAWLLVAGLLFGMRGYSTGVSGELLISVLAAVIGVATIGWVVHSGHEL